MSIDITSSIDSYEYMEKHYRQYADLYKSLHKDEEILGLILSGQQVNLLMTLLHDVTINMRGELDEIKKRISK